MCCGNKRRANKAQMVANMMATVQSHANQQRRIPASSNQPSRGLPPSAGYNAELPSDMPKALDEKSGEKLAKAGVRPPSYDIVVNRTMIPPEPATNDLTNGTSRFPRPINTRNDTGDLSDDDDEFFEMLNGERAQRRGLQPAMSNASNPAVRGSGQSDLITQLLDTMRLPKHERKALWREAKYRHKAYKRGGCGAGSCSPCSSGYYKSCASYAPGLGGEERQIGWPVPLAGDEVFVVLEGSPCMK